MRRALLLLILAIGSLALVGIGVHQAAQDPVVARYRLAMPGLQTPLRIVQLTDSHASRIDMPPNRLARVVAQINALHPDIIVLTGDYVSGDPASWDNAATATALAPFKQLRAPLGIFAVLGNHDNPEATRAALADGPVRLLVGERIDAGPVQIVGADDITRDSPAVEAMRRAIARGVPGRPMMVIAHEPVFFYWLRQKVPVVMLTGHTHGGQIHLPFIGSLHFDAYSRAHRRGLFVEGRHRMIVSSGLGTTYLPIRIGVPPEIVELTLTPVQTGRNSGTER